MDIAETTVVKEEKIQNNTVKTTQSINWSNTGQLQ